MGEKEISRTYRCTLQMFPRPGPFTPRYAERRYLTKRTFVGTDGPGDTRSVDEFYTSPARGPPWSGSSFGLSPRLTSNFRSQVGHLSPFATFACVGVVSQACAGGEKSRATPCSSFRAQPRLLVRRSLVDRSLSRPPRNRVNSLLEVDVFRTGRQVQLSRLCIL